MASKPYTRRKMATFNMNVAIFYIRNYVNSEFRNYGMLWLILQIWGATILYSRRYGRFNGCRLWHSSYA